jgi:hypothetical protein
MMQKFNLKRMIKNEKTLLCVLFIALGLITFLVSREEEKVEIAPSRVPNLADMVPPGWVLISIELANRDAISSIVGSTAVVDLLSVNPDTLSPQTKIASRVRMVRAPQDPEKFAVLVLESTSVQFSRFPGPYFALVQNKERANSRILEDRKPRKIQINYQE